MERYDASRSPDAEAWQALDEDERILLVREYHRRIGEELPEEQRNVLHAMAHVIVETQLSLDVDPVPDTLTRLMREGLDRHEAIHAIGAVVMGELYDARNNEEANMDRYAKRLRELDARKWREGEY